MVGIDERKMGEPVALIQGHSNVRLELGSTSKIRKLSITTQIPFCFHQKLSSKVWSLSELSLDRVALLDRIMARRAWEGQMTDRPAAERSDNLFEPVEENRGTRGRFTSESQLTAVSASEAWV
jgi:hypothetical protein